MKILLLLLLPFNVFANDWSAADTWRESGWQVINIIDWGQTLDIIERENDGYYEGNPILGKHPSRGEVNRHFILGGITHFGVSRWLTPDNRKTWQWLTIGFGAGTVWHNYRIGIKVNF